tara:strand:- start:1153 stop:1713 length:561 start_codon:yes stop_codon:yes gene_type:complete
MEIPKNIYFKIRPLILPISDILKFIPPYSSILDLGCGKGLLVKHIKNFKSYTGVDLNLMQRDISKNIKFIKDDCSQFIDNDLKKFNTFLLIDLLHHIPKDKQTLFLNKLIKNIKIGDIIIIKDILPRGLVFKFWNSFHDYIISKQIINYFEFNNFKESLNPDISIVADYYKRIFLYDHYFLILKKN